MVVYDSTAEDGLAGQVPFSGSEAQANRFVERLYSLTPGRFGRDGLVHGGSPDAQGPSGRTPLLGPSPLRTVRKAFAVYGSSPSIAFLRKTRFRDGEM